MSQNVEKQKQTMARITALNQQIVEARRKGQHSRVQALKQKVQDILITQSLSRQPQSSKSTNETNETTESPRLKETTNRHENNDSNTATQKTSTTSTTTDGADKPNSMKEVMARIQELNLEIVAARKQGEHDLAVQLQDEVKRLMSQGIALGR